MNFLFWLIWALDLLGLGVVFAAADWRSVNGAHDVFTSFHFWSIVFLIIALIGGPILRYGFKLTGAALGLVALPWLVLLIAYIVDKKTNRA